MNILLLIKFHILGFMLEVKENLFPIFIIVLFFIGVTITIISQSNQNKITCFRLGFSQEYSSLYVETFTCH